jgi:hypothetical protein
MSVSPAARNAQKYVYVNRTYYPDCTPTNADWLTDAEYTGTRTLDPAVQSVTDWNCIAFAGTLSARMSGPAGTIEVNVDITKTAGSGSISLSVSEVCDPSAPSASDACGDTIAVYLSAEIVDEIVISGFSDSIGQSIRFQLIANTGIIRGVTHEAGFAPGDPYCALCNLGAGDISGTVISHTVASTCYVSVGLTT